jgi:hypothetical protein
VRFDEVIGLFTVGFMCTTAWMLIDEMAIVLLVARFADTAQSRPR